MAKTYSPKSPPLAGFFFRELLSEASLSAVQLDRGELSSPLCFQDLFKTFKIFIGDLGLHWAMLWSAHGTKLRLLVDISWQSFIVILLGPLRVE